VAVDNVPDQTHGSQIEHVEPHHDRPEEWGWHHEFTAGRQIGGWITFIVLGLMLTTTHYNRTGNVALIATMAVLAFGLLWDRRRRRTQWRG
jgi:drug/metabolite transporter (DMT)-like permease